jgi:hypothetical protein
VVYLGADALPSRPRPHTMTHLNVRFGHLIMTPWDYPSSWSESVLSGGAGGGTRTRNIQFGRLALYQLSYAREIYRMLKSTPTC